MKTTQNDSEFDPRQKHFTKELLRTIKRDLTEHGIPENELEDVVGSLAFSVGTLIDGSGGLSMGDKPFVPFLTFATDGERNDIIAGSNGSFVHEHVYELIDEVFEEEDDDDDEGEE